uniref:Uncharacterized protein n=1 Tax=Arundo donax TaxID=35708 RepID=A0A0A9CH84_ARUDO
MIDHDHLASLKLGLTVSLQNYLLSCPEACLKLFSI